MGMYKNNMLGFPGGTRNVILANIVACFLFMFVVIGYRSQQWGLYFWGIFVPFVLFEWKKYGIKPSIKIDRFLLWGMAVAVLCLIISSICIKDLDSLNRAVRYIKDAFSFFMIAYLVQNFPTKKGALAGINLSLIILCVYGIYKWYNTGEANMLSIYSQHNPFGTSLELLIPFNLATVIFVAQKPLKICAFLLSILSVFCILMSDSRGAIIGLALGIFLSLIIYVTLFIKRISKQKLIRVTALALFVLGIGASSVFLINKDRIAKFGDDGGGERSMMITASYNMWKDHKAFGVGLSNWQDNYYGQYRPEGQREKGLSMPHNMIAYYLSTTGVIGLLGYFSYYILTFIGLLRLLKMTPSRALLLAGLIIFLAFGIHGMVNGTLNDKKISRVYFALLGFAVSSYTAYSLTKK